MTEDEDTSIDDNTYYLTPSTNKTTEFAITPQ